MDHTHFVLDHKHSKEVHQGMLYRMNMVTQDCTTHQLHVQMCFIQMPLHKNHSTHLSHIEIM